MKVRIPGRIISAATGLALVLAVCQSIPGRTVNADSETTSSVAAGSADGTFENPFDRQDDMEVPYDRKSWIQPRDWNCPKIDPKDYDGGIMLYFDKIWLEPEYSRGKVQRVYFSITGATEPVSHIKFHIFYDTRLTVRENSDNKVLTAGRALEGFTTDSAMVEEGQLAFCASSENTLLNNGCLFTIDFVVPENAEQGEVYPIGLYYVDDGIARDMFIDSEEDDAGRLQMTYVFTKGIYNGYIRMKGEKKTTPAAPANYTLGDVNGDGRTDAVDASAVLVYYSRASTGQDGDFTEEQELAADVNCDSRIDAKDTSAILAYYAMACTASGDVPTPEEYMEGKKA